MLLRAILFSSDERIAQTLIPVFAEFGIQMEPCGEIFAAVERMTMGGFDAVVADWSEELEASFFLKTARELKCVKSALALAVVQQKDVDQVFKAGVDGVLIRPLTTEQVRNALLTVGRFSPPQNTSPLDARVEFALPQRIPGESVEGPVSGTTLATEEPPLFGSMTPVSALTSSGAPSLSKYTQNLAGRLASGTRNRKRMLLSALGVMLAASASFAWHDGYVPSASRMSEKFGAWLSGAGATFQGVTNSANDGVLDPRGVEPVPAPIVSRSEAFNPFEEQTAAISEGQIEVKPIIPPAPVSTVAEPRPAARQPEETEAEVNASPSLPAENIPTLHPAVGTPRIPASLLAPVHEIVGKVPAAKAAAAARWVMQPIALPEDVARRLLIHQVAPAYPMEALKTGMEGVVVLQAFVGKDGSIQDLKMVNGYMIFGHAAFDAVKQWRFEPYRLNGEFVNMQTLITLNFKHPQP